MAASIFATTHYTSEQFVESSGAILFDFSQEKAKVCLIHYAYKDEWLLAKGRRNCDESRRDAAIREAQEETGYQCHPYPVTMPTRAPAATDNSDVPDKVRTHPGVTEPFMLSIRKLEEGKSNVKVIWWYIAEVKKNVQKSGVEADFISEFFDYDEAMQRLRFQGDRDVLNKAISLVIGS